VSTQQISVAILVPLPRALLLTGMHHWKKFFVSEGLEKKEERWSSIHVYTQASQSAVTCPIY
jgi:hypothetical protein